MDFRKHASNAIGNWWQFQRIAQVYCQTRAGGQCFSALLQDGARWALETEGRKNLAANQISLHCHV